MLGCIKTRKLVRKVTLAHFQGALEITREYDFEVTYDLKSAYHHIKIHPSQTKYLGAAIKRPDGTIQYFVFLFLLFGLSSAVHCITKLFKPINAYIHEKGIKGTYSRYGSKLIPAREFAGTLGKIVSTEPALGPVVIMAARASYVDLDEAIRQRGWNTQLKMSRESLDGLKFFAENCDDFDNTPIRSSATEISVLSIIGPPSAFMKSSFVANHVRTDEEKIWASDASGYATCAYSIKGDHLYYRGILNESERSLGYFSNKRIGEEPYPRSVASYGSLQKLNFRIIPIHLLREDPRIKIADDGSKTVDTDDWQVDDETFQNSNQEYNFKVDLFVSNQNKKCKRFYRNLYCPDTSGVDTFSHSWDGEVAWICPPIKEVTRTIRRLRKSRTTGCYSFLNGRQPTTGWKFSTVKIRCHGRLRA